MGQCSRYGVSKNIQGDLGSFNSQSDDLYCRMCMPSATMEKPLRVFIIPSILPNRKSLDLGEEGSDCFFHYKIRMANSAMVHNAALNIRLIINIYIMANLLICNQYSILLLGPQG